jgi:hypothetical protein
MDVRFLSSLMERFELGLENKNSAETQKRSKKKLTNEMKIDNLEKFAKTSLVAEVILDRLKASRKEVERAI